MRLTVLTDYLGRKVRLTAERRQHILQHPEMIEGADKIGDVLAHPKWVFVPDLTPGSELGSGFRFLDTSS
jgi:hypothetical protein